MQNLFLFTHMIHNLNAIQIAQKWQKWPPFPKNVLNVRLLSDFIRIKKENGNLNIFCKFKHHSMYIFFRMVT